MSVETLTETQPRWDSEPARTLRLPGRGVAMATTEP